MFLISCILVQSDWFSAAQHAESLEKLNQELTCPICLKHFEEPKVLPCCHYYCRECIVQMQARTRGKDYFQCPECRKETRLPGNDPDRLATLAKNKQTLLFKGNPAC